MLRGTTTLNQQGIAPVIGAMILLLLNASVWLVFNTGSERMSFQRALQTSTARKAYQHVVDNAAAVVQGYCSSLVFGPTGTGPTSPISEAAFRAEGIDLTTNFRSVYTTLGFPDPKAQVVVKAFPADAPARMPAGATPILSGLQTTIEVGTGTRQVKRVFTIPVMMNSPTSGNYSISACRTDEESTHCYMNSNALYYNLPAPAYVVQPTHSNPTPQFDDTQSYGRVACFSDLLRTNPTWCTPKTNTLATALRGCMAVAREESQFVHPGGPGMTGTPADLCRSVVNLPTVLGTCVGGAP